MTHAILNLSTTEDETGKKTFPLNLLEGAFMLRIGRQGVVEHTVREGCSKPSFETLCKCQEALRRQCDRVMISVIETALSIALQRSENGAGGAMHARNDTRCTCRMK